MRPDGGRLHPCGAILAGLLAAFEAEWDARKAAHHDLENLRNRTRARRTRRAHSQHGEGHDPEAAGDGAGEAHGG